VQFAIELGVLDRRIEEGELQKSVGFPSSGSVR